MSKTKTPAWEKAVEKALQKPRPPEGWPKPEPRRKRKKPLSDEEIGRLTTEAPPGPYLPAKKKPPK